MRTTACVRSFGGIFIVAIAALVVGGGCASLDDDDASTCAKAGGVCELGGRPCAATAPSAALDCNPDRNPGGAFCCVQVGDGGSGD